jgi:hypothetical protein
MLQIVNHTGPRRLVHYQAKYPAGKSGTRARPMAGPVMTPGQGPAMVRTAAVIPPVFLVGCLPMALVARGLSAVAATPLRHQAHNNAL